MSASSYLLVRLELLIVVLHASRRPRLAFLISSVGHMAMVGVASKTRIERSSFESVFASAISRFYATEVLEARDV
jgi:hypothetical protein